MNITKVFTNGRSQAVRIPKEYRFDENEVYINKIGETIVLTPIRSLAQQFEIGAKLLTDDFLSDGIPSGKDSYREKL